MDIAAILVKYGWAGIISLALVWVTKTFLVFINKYIDNQNEVIKTDIATMDRANMLLQDVREELRLSQEQRKESMKHVEWCQKAVVKLGDVSEVLRIVKGD